jgi:hypothetical protein
VDDGTRTHDGRDHNPGLYQLSYVHHRHRHEPSRINGLRSSKPFGQPSMLLKIQGCRQVQMPREASACPLAGRRSIYEPLRMGIGAGGVVE